MITTFEPKVINRHGVTEDWNIQKLREAISWATEKYDVNPLHLESALKGRIPAIITTNSIQENLIVTALELCTNEAPDWRYVAGQLIMWNLYHKIKIARGITGDIYEDYYTNVIVNQFPRGNYQQTLLQVYGEHLKTIGKIIKPEFDRDYDYAGANLLINRYLLEGELPQESYLTMALLLAAPENLPMNKKLILVEKFYTAIASRKISLSTPLLANLRTNKGGLTSCFILAMDDTLDSIYTQLHNVAKISKNGGGVGVNVSAIRATGSMVNQRTNVSGGVIPWVKLLNDTAIAVNQAGVRAGAITVSLDSWHLDLPEFLEIQEETGDQRRKAFDIFPQIVVTDEFMRRVEKNENWTLFDPYEVKQITGHRLERLWGEQFETIYRELESKINNEIKLYKVINAKDLYKKIMQVQLETGSPYIAFKDTINRTNPNKHDGYIPGVNLCTESFSNVEAGKFAHCCNLVSLNFANLTKAEIPFYSRLAVRILDNSIDLTQPPFQDAADHNQRYRTIGVGIMGLFDYLALNNLSINSLTEISELTEIMFLSCIKESINLAREKGAYPAFKSSDWDAGIILNYKNIEEQSISYKEEWKLLKKNLRKFGIRNSQLMAIAPNTSSSLVQGCTASILPPYGRFFIDKGSATVPILPSYINKYYWHYPENKTLDQNKIVDLVASIQKWVDTGISMELLFNLNEKVYNFVDNPDRAITPRDIFHIHLKAWKKGCKTIYYTRSVQKDPFLEECTACAN